MDEVRISTCLISKAPSHSIFLCLLVLTGNDNKLLSGRDGPSRCIRGVHGLPTEGLQQCGAIAFYKGKKRACSLLSVELLFV